MKTARKAILAVMCVLCVIVASITGTLAYLTDDDAVVNTFTVGNVKMTMDETDVDDTDGDKNVTERDRENVYHLIPGQQYAKDPIVHVEANSEDAWVFVLVENGLMYGDNTKTIEVPAKVVKNEVEKQLTIDGQILDNGWTSLGTVGNKTLYYRAHTKADEQKDYDVFTQFKINGEIVVNEPATGETVPAGKISIGDFQTEGNTGKFINVNAYAIQMAGFDDVKDAWVAGNWGTFTIPAEPPVTP